jgi:hypothetical protein
MSPKKVDLGLLIGLLGLLAGLGVEPALLLGTLVGFLAGSSSR